MLGEVSRHRPASAVASRLDDRAVAYDVSGAGDRRTARLFRPRRLGARGARPEEDRRRHRHPPPHPDAPSSRPSRRTDAEARRRFLTFVVIGGGPTGVEMAGAIAELRPRRAAPRFPHHQSARGAHRAGRGGPAPAAGLPGDAERGGAALARTAACRGAPGHAGHPLRRSGRDDRRAAARGRHHRLGGRRRGLVGGAAGWASTQDRVGRVVVGPDLTVPGHPEIFVIGDTAHALDGDGQPLPGLAPVAKQQGAYVARAAARAARPAGRRRRRSATATTAPWRPSAGAPPSPISAGSAIARHARLAAVGPGPCLVPDRLQEPPGRDARLAVVLRDLPVRRAADHRVCFTHNEPDCVRRRRIADHPATNEGASDASLVQPVACRRGIRCWRHRLPSPAATRPASSAGPAALPQSPPPGAPKVEIEPAAMVRWSRP